MKHCLRVKVSVLQTELTLALASTAVARVLDMALVEDVLE
jgi:hypothetical protein